MEILANPARRIVRSLVLVQRQKVKMTTTIEVMKKKKFQQKTMNNEREDSLELVGTVEEALPGTLFKIKTTTGQTVLATLSGKLRQNHIVILPGDEVAVEVSIYDTTRGRIKWRR